MHVLRCGVSTPEPTQVAHPLSLLRQQVNRRRQSFRFVVVVHQPRPSAAVHARSACPLVRVVVAAGRLERVSAARPRGKITCQQESPSGRDVIIRR